MTKENEPNRLAVADEIREHIDHHRLATYFLLVELVFIFGAWYLDTWMSITLTQGGPDMSDIMAGLLGGWAVVFALIGLLGVILLGASRLWLKVGRRSRQTVG